MMDKSSSPQYSQAPPLRGFSIQQRPRLRTKLTVDVMLATGSAINSRLREAARAVTNRALNKDGRADEAGDRDESVKSPQLLLSDLEVDRLKIAFDMHSSAGGGGGCLEDRRACNTEGGENVVYVEDLKDLLRTLFIVPTKSELRSLTSAMDSDQTGRIDFSCFLNAVAGFMKPQYGREKIDDAFDEISGGSDEIDANSLQRAMIHLGQSTLRYADCEAMIREVDRRGRGSISREDFHHLQTCALDTV